MINNWHIACANKSLEESLVRALGINPITAQILINRGINSTASARTYLNPTLADIPDPFFIPDMAKATRRIIGAIESKEKIGIFGDYDVDGITGSALLSFFLKILGHETVIALPDRMGEGYGLTKSAIDNFHAQKVNLIITVDNGTRAVDEAIYAKSLGIDIIITDHHDANGELPVAEAIVNPKRSETPEAYKNLSGCGVAFMLALGLRKTLRDLGKLPSPEPNLKEHLDLVALGTVADVMPLDSTNRILVKYGLTQISEMTKPGIQALIDVSSTNSQALNPDTIAFQLAPRINAAGRMGSAGKALELLLCCDPVHAAEIAKLLNTVNYERQKTEAHIIDQALNKIATDLNLDESSAIVLAQKDWHIGVIGIAAAKISQQFRMPTVIISLDSKPARGSARGIANLNLVEALAACGDVLSRFGGHAMAAGLSIEKDNVELFTKRFNEACRKLLPQDYTHKLFIDAKVEPEDITESLIKEISSCRPFGLGNPEPILAMENVDVVDKKVVGTNHLKLCVKSGNKYFGAIAFGMANNFPAGAEKLSLAFVPEFNTWNGVTSIQLKIKDVKTSL